MISGLFDGFFFFFFFPSGVLESKERKKPCVSQGVFGKPAMDMDFHNRLMKMGCGRFV